MYLIATLSQMEIIYSVAIAAIHTEKYNNKCNNNVLFVYLIVLVLKPTLLQAFKLKAKIK